MPLDTVIVLDGPAGIGSVNSPAWPVSTVAITLGVELPAAYCVPEEPVFCGLGGGKLQPTVLARTISRCASRAGLTKHVTAHTLRHTAATWLRQATGDTRLVAEYLGHADLSTVSRYAHVASEEMHAAVQALADETGLSGRPNSAGEQVTEDAREET